MLLLPQEAFQKLIYGNIRYVENIKDADTSSERRLKLYKKGQHPYATIITCSDSRVPPEYIFDCDIGDLFVIRTAGNVIGDFELGSVEYAVEHLNTPLVVVMGHTHCGAVAAALEKYLGDENTIEGKLESILEEIEPAVEKALPGKDVDSYLDTIVIQKSERYNTENSMNKLKSSSILEKYREEGSVQFLSAIYQTDTGEVLYYV